MKISRLQIAFKFLSYRLDMKEGKRMTHMLTKEQIFPFWRTLLGLKKNEDLENHLKLFFQESSELILVDLNRERENTIIQYSQLSNTSDTITEVDFFKKEFAYFTTNLQNYLYDIKVVNNKKKFLEHSLKQMEGILEKELLPFIIDEAKLFFDEDNDLINKEISDPLDYFLKYRFHTEHYRDQCEIIYPQLFILVNNLINSYLTFVKEIIEHIEVDISKIGQKYFPDNNNITLLKIELDNGDRHQDGKSVAKLTFNSGNLYYKPRSAQLDTQFYNFLDMLSAFGLGYDFKRINILDRGQYSYFEEISYVKSINDNEFELYYEKLGCLLAILYTLNGTDFHSENIIAHSSDPMLIDLESLFHSNIFINENLYDKNFLQLLKLTEPSVIDVGILPKKIVKNYDSDDYSLEIGGIGADEAKPSPFKYSKLVKDEENHVKHIRSFGVNSVSENNPIEVIKDEHLIVINDQMKKGFKHAYKFVLDYREDYIDLVNDIFSNLAIRVILRPTYLYSKFLSLSKNIFILGNSINKKILFSKLAYERKNQMDYVYSEYKQLMNNDIPFFISNTSSNKICDYTGSILGILSKDSPLENVIRKIQKMNLKDLENQLTLINQTINLKEYRGDKTGISFNSKSIGIHETKPLNAEAMDIAVKIGDLLIERSINCTADNITWISTTLLGKEEIEFGVGPVGNDVYLGNAGISIFLSYLYRYSGKQRFKDATLKSVNYNIEFLEQEKLYENGNIGYYNGTGGILLSLAVINQDVPIPGFNKIMNSSLQRLERLVSESNNYDLFTGSSGLISSLLEIENIYPGEYTISILPLVETSYKHLISKALFEDNYAYWKTSFVQPYIGYAHGNAGILASLCKLKSVEQQLFGKNIVDIEFLEKISNYIDTAYNVNENNWSTIPGNQKYSTGWCHGVQGLLLSQCQVIQSCPELSKGDIYISNLVDLIKQNGFGKNPSFCHGDLGSLKVLEIYARTTDNQQLLIECENLFSDIFETTIKKKWKTQVLSHSESLGLMIGVSGWGYSILDHLHSNQMFNFLKI